MMGSYTQLSIAEVCPILSKILQQLRSRTVEECWKFETLWYAVQLSVDLRRYYKQRHIIEKNHARRAFDESFIVNKKSSVIGCNKSMIRHCVI